MYIQELFEQVLAADDFLLFKSSMVRRNIELELQALNLLKNQMGHSPVAYDKDSSATDTGRERTAREREEEDEQIMREAVKLSEEQYRLERSTEDKELQELIEQAKRESLELYRQQQQHMQSLVAEQREGIPGLGGSEEREGVPGLGGSEGREGVPGLGGSEGREDFQSGLAEQREAVPALGGSEGREGGGMEDGVGPTSTTTSDEEDSKRKSTTVTILGSQSRERRKGEREMNLEREVISTEESNATSLASAPQFIPGAGGGGEREMNPEFEGVESEPQNLTTQHREDSKL